MLNDQFKMKVGILALQGSFAEHAQILQQLKIGFIYVRTKEDLKDLTHLIIPGGESTTLRKLLETYGMWESLKLKVESGKLKVFGTCAGAILCQYLGMDVEICRNGFGAQQSSFVAPLDSKKFPELQGVFIRAPRFLSVGNDVEVLASFKNEPVLVQQGPFLALSFHPELCDEARIHEYFLNK